MEDKATVTNTKGEVFYKSIGTVKKFNEETGYGFIFSIDEPDQDIYVHATQVITSTDGVNTLKPGDNVEFLYKNFKDQGLRAYQVKVL